jgi:hypothetical protein
MTPGSAGQPGTEAERKMGDPMKTKILAMAGAVLLSIIGAGVCGAQTRTLEVNVPFAFEVGNKTMPAGSYRVETVLTGNGSLQVLRSNSGEARLTISMPTAPNIGALAPSLIFHRYGNHYFLAQIRTGGGHARDLYPTLQEKELARSEPRVEVAVLVQTPALKP